MQEQNIRQMPNFSPGADILPIRSKGKTAARQPLQEILADVRDRFINGRANPAGRVVQGLVPESVGIGVMVVQAPDNVTAIAADVDVFGLWRKHQGVHR